MHQAICKFGINDRGLSLKWKMLIGLQKGYDVKALEVYHYSTIRFETRDDNHFHSILKRMNHESSKLLDMTVHSKFFWSISKSLRLNWDIGKYTVIPNLLLKKVLGR